MRDSAVPDIDSGPATLQDTHQQEVIQKKYDRTVQTKISQLTSSKVACHMHRRSGGVYRDRISRLRLRPSARCSERMHIRVAVRLVRLSFARLYEVVESSILNVLSGRKWLTILLVILLCH